MSTIKKRFILIVLLFNSIFSFGQKPELKIPSGYNDTYYIKSIKYSKDGKYLIVASEEGVKIFDNETARELRNINCFAEIQAEISFDNKYLINSYFSGRDNPISYVYDVSTGSKIFPLDGDISKFSPDNKYVATANFDYGINIYELSTGNLVNRFSFNLPTPQAAYISDIEFSPDNKQIAIFGETGGMKTTQTYIYDILSGIKLNTIKGHSPKYSNDGKHIFTINNEYTPRLHRGGRGFEPLIAHIRLQQKCWSFFYDISSIKNSRKSNIWFEDKSISPTKRTNSIFLNLSFFLSSAKDC